MNAQPERPACPEADLAAAQARIRQLEGELVEAEQELKAASDIISEQEVSLECLRLQRHGSASAAQLIQHRIEDQAVIERPGHLSMLARG